MHYWHVGWEAVLPIEGFSTNAAGIDKVPCKVYRLHVAFHHSLLLVWFSTGLADKLTRLLILLDVFLQHTDIRAYMRKGKYSSTNKGNFQVYFCDRLIGAHRDYSFHWRSCHIHYKNRWNVQGNALPRVSSNCPCLYCSCHKQYKKRDQSAHPYWYTRWGSDICCGQILKQTLLYNND